MNDVIQDLTGAADILKKIDELKMLLYIVIVIGVVNILLHFAKDRK